MKPDFHSFEIVYAWWTGTWVKGTLLYGSWGLIAMLTKKKKRDWKESTTHQLSGVATGSCFKPIKCLRCVQINTCKGQQATHVQKAQDKNISRACVENEPSFIKKKNIIKSSKARDWSLTIRSWYRPRWPNLISWGGKTRRQEGRLVLFPLALFHISVCSGMTTPHQPWQEKVGSYQCE